MSLYRMLDQFNSYLTSARLYSKKDSLLVACSGGIDSMVLCDLLLRAGIPFALAHANFNLRIPDADEDAAFIEAYGKQHQLRTHIKTFNTKAYAQEHHISTQMAARELRYEWFQQLSKSEDYTKIATAHHANDTAETIVMNLSRGTGIKGLRGIQPRVNNTIRPLLFASRKMIEAYAQQQDIKWREDYTNAEDHYKRNYTRHQIIPAMEELNPSFIDKASRFATNMQETHALLMHFVSQHQHEWVEQDGDAVLIKKVITEVPGFQSLLHILLSPYGFTPDQVRNICLHLDGRSGIAFTSNSHELICDRTHLIITPLHIQSPDIQISNFPCTINIHNNVFHATITTSFADYKKSGPHQVYLDYHKVRFPLTLRAWKKGDWFIPLGMKGKKKISDLMIDQKIPVNFKKRQYLLCSDEQIAWVPGIRPDDRFKITPKTTKAIKCSIHDQTI